jgi:DNA-binding NarL/FixJ family response regulator
MRAVIRVMVVEDHDLTRSTLCQILTAESDLDVVACCSSPRSRRHVGRMGCSG